MIAAWMVKMSINQIVGMIAVWYGIMSAAWSMFVAAVMALVLGSTGFTI